VGKNKDLAGAEVLGKEWGIISLGWEFFLFGGTGVLTKGLTLSRQELYLLICTQTSCAF
jgi:hypothetical protein